LWGVFLAWVYYSGFSLLGQGEKENVGPVWPDGKGLRSSDGTKSVPGAILLCSTLRCHAAQGAGRKGIKPLRLRKPAADPCGICSPFAPLRVLMSLQPLALRFDVRKPSLFLHFPEKKT
jgi:hypothetical protein